MNMHMKHALDTNKTNVLDTN